MNTTTAQLVDHATSSLATGKPRTYGILNHPEKGLFFAGRGSQRPVLNLWLRFGNRVWDLKTFSGQLILQRGIHGAPAWFVLMDENWEYIGSSADETSDFCCIAIMGASRAAL